MIDVPFIPEDDYVKIQKEWEWLMISTTNRVYFITFITSILKILGYV